MRRAAGFAFACALALAGPVARAEPSLRAIIATASPIEGDATVARLRGELTVMGFAVEVVQVPRATEGARSNEALAASRGASVVLRMDRDPKALGLTLWIDPSVAAPLAGGAGSAAGPASAHIDASGSDDDPSLLALRAAELLRARLVKLPAPLEPPPPPPPVPAAPAVRATSPPAPLVLTPTIEADAASKRERPHPVGIAVAPAVLWSPGGVSSSVGVRAGASVDPWAATAAAPSLLRRLGFDLTAFVPASKGSVTGDDATVQVSMLTLGGGFHATLTRPESIFFASAGAGLGAARIAYQGEAMAPLMGQSGSLWRVAPYVTAGAGVRLHPMVALRLDLAAMVMGDSPPNVMGQNIANYGLPTLVPSFGLEVRP